VEQIHDLAAEQRALARRSASRAVVEQATAAGVGAAIRFILGGLAVVLALLLVAHLLARTL
jgi:hypothetical protein